MYWCGWEYGWEFMISFGIAMLTSVAYSRGKVLYTLSFKPFLN